MRLSELTANAGNVGIAGGGDPEILGLTSDSREVQPGFLFAALPGARGDGAAHIGDAVARGAAAVLCSGIPAVDPGVPRVVTDDARKALGEFAEAFYGYPSRSLILAGITGTNGKTTTAYLLRHILNRAGMRAGMLGTVEYDLGDKIEPAPLTTPDAVRFSRSLAEMRDSGCAAAVTEVSSHALEQKRAWPHRFAVAAFTNLTRDHLDYHGDMDAYLEAKRGLFMGLDAGAAAVLNFRDPAAPRMALGTRARLFGYCLAEAGQSLPEGLPAGTMRAESVEDGLDGQRFRVSGYGIEGEFFTPLVGRHNTENCVGALLTAHALGVAAGVVRSALADFPGVPGRMERIDSGRGVRAFVDYSHTDGALRSVLSVLRPLVKGRLITVFGCGGDRDHGKRPMMAKAAEELSDIVVATSDNPRTEDPEAILRDVAAGFTRSGGIFREADRPAAVRMAVDMASAGDVILLAGKGHENYQIVGSKKHHMDDRELLRDAFGLNTGPGDSPPGTASKGTDK